MATDNLLHISSSPHIRNAKTVPTIMRDVVIAMIPALIMAVIFFGVRALLMVVIAVISALLTEQFIAKKLLKKASPIGNWSAIITGMLLAFNLPVGAPLWIPALGSIFAIAVAKWTFGGLGNNFINPALAGRAFLLASYPAYMTGSIFTQSGWLGKLPSPLAGMGGEVAENGIDALAGATPLVTFKNQITNANIDLGDALNNLIMGNVGGCLGETSAIALILGGLYLLYRGVIGSTIPAIYIGTVFLLYWLFGGTGAELLSSDAITAAVYQVFAGGLILGAFFMATDMVTSPITHKGQAMFALGCGIFTFIIRKFGGYPEGVSYSILLMNLVVPLIDRYIKPRVYGVGGQ